jgi:hypothetical protein
MGGMGGAGGGPGGQAPTGTPPTAAQNGTTTTEAASTSTTSSTGTTTSTSERPSAPTGGGGMGGTTTSTELVAMLKATTGTWSAATIGAQSAASLELTSGTSVMGIGGWSGSDAAPTLAQFKAYVASGQVRYFIASGGGMVNQSNEITEWVTSTFTSTTVGSTTVYDLTSQA